MKLQYNFLLTPFQNGYVLLNISVLLSVLIYIVLPDAAHYCEIASVEFLRLIVVTNMVIDLNIVHGLKVVNLI